MSVDYSIAQWFGGNLAVLLADKVSKVYPSFKGGDYVRVIKREVEGLGYSARVELHADTLKKFLPDEYTEAVKILTAILGEENPEETGMFKKYYWILPIGKFVEKYGLDNCQESLKAIEAITKRNTGEYAIRPYLRKYPRQTIARMKKWSKSKNFHLRRLASEGVRPKLPWATKLEQFIEDPKPVFDILNNLMEDDVKFVKKSVANNITDYLKVNKPAAAIFIKSHQNSSNPHTKWILKHATRKISL